MGKSEIDIRQCSALCAYNSIVLKSAGLASRRARTADGVLVESSWACCACACAKSGEQATAGVALCGCWSCAGGTSLMAVSEINLKIGGCDIGVDESLGYDLYDDISLVAGELKIQEKNSIIMIDIADAGIAVHGEGVGIDG